MNIKGMLVLDTIIGGDFSIQNFTCIVHAKIKTCELSCSICYYCTTVTIMVIVP